MTEEAPAAEGGTTRAPVEVRVARYGIIGALAGALIGAIVAGFFTYLSAHDQITGQAQQSQTDFLRGQRQTAYSALVNDALKTQNLGEQYDNQVEDAVGQSPNDFPAPPADLEADVLQVGVDDSNIQIIGSAVASKTAAALTAAIENLYGGDPELRASLIEAANNTSISKRDDEDENGVVKAEQSFLAAAKDDLDTSK